MEPSRFLKTLIKIRTFKKYLFFFLFCLNTSCYEVQRNCLDFRYGTFKYERVIGDKLSTSIFIRNNEMEIEYYNNKTDTSKIKWVNKCEFILTKLNPNNNNEKKPISIKIISTHKNYYVFEFSLVGNNTKRQRGKIVKISDSLDLPLEL